MLGTLHSRRRMDRPSLGSDILVRLDEAGSREVVVVVFVVVVVGRRLDHPDGRFLGRHENPGRWRRVPP